MLAHLRRIPNQLTAIRFLSIPVMWLCAFMKLPIYIGIGLIVGFVTDVLDGLVARKLNQVSEFGSKFDSLADNLLQLSAMVWVLMLKPEIFRENLTISLLAIGIYVLSLSVGLLKFRRFADLHLYLSKAGGLFSYVFLVHAFLFGQYSKWLFFLAAGGFILSSTETLLLQLLLPSVDEHLGSIFFLFLPDDHPIRVWCQRLP